MSGSLAMTEEQLNRSLCEWLGWRKSEGDAEYPWVNPETRCRHRILPDHISTLEALGRIHEAEKRLSREQYIKFCNHLAGREETNYLKAVSAPARKRAVALLRTVNPELFK